MSNEITRYILSCKKCNYSYQRRWAKWELGHMVNKDPRHPGISCSKCGYPGMKIEAQAYQHDRFEPGIQAPTGRYAGTKSEFYRQLKEMNLVLIGGEEIKETKRPSIWTDDLLKKAHENGVKLSGEQMKALKAGKKLGREDELKHNVKKMADYDKTISDEDKMPDDVKASRRDQLLAQ